LRYNANKLTVPPFKLDFGSRGFRVAAPTVWNALPDYIRACTSPSLFSRELKTFYMCSAFKTILRLSPRLRFDVYALTIVRVINFYYYYYYYYFVLICFVELVIFSVILIFCNMQWPMVVDCNRLTCV
jgi:hypothetical protein